MLILTPDISVIGYVLNMKIGAVAYNIFHHKAIALVVYVCGFYFHTEAMRLAGIILFAHSCMDRMLGYGLKYFQGFQFTHLGKIGKHA